MTCHILLQHSIFSSLLFSLMMIIFMPTDSDAALAKHGCNDTCGGISIPYPFGIGLNCSYSSWFDITCKTTSYPRQVPFLTMFDVEVYDISIGYNNSDDLGEVVIVGIIPFNVCTTPSNATKFTSLDLRHSPFRYSASANEFVLQGCPGIAFFTNQSGDMVAACAIGVRNDTNQLARKSGFTTCGAPYLSSPGSLPLDYFQVVLLRDNDIDASAGGGGGGSEDPNCLFATLVSNSSFGKFLHTGLSNCSTPAPTVLEWRFPDTKYVLDEDFHPLADCHEQDNTCRCKNGYKGNPYFSHGCEAIKECMKCRGWCAFDSERNSYYCTNQNEVPTMTTTGFLIGLINFGCLFLLLCCVFSFPMAKKRKEIKQRAKNFKRNGGLLLQQRLSASKCALEKTQIFTTTELGTATDQFNEDQVLGQGGQGTVYKGVLTDGRLVAIKKSKQVDQSQIEHFINEVVILSQINHRNVVKLLGCCLETEVPLLVYEFIANGTLYQHIHDPDENSRLSWEMRLSIAFESAGAVAYLHSSSSPPIYHRDIKSVNILLDNKNRAKVSDFGCSKTISNDQSHLTTLVRGTFGYLDPEYFYSNQFSEKSDVYSFGVVLVELLTSKNPIFIDDEESSELDTKNLAGEFVSMMENGCVIEFLDPLVVEEAKEEEIFVVVDLAKQCLSSSGKMRPTMREVATVLEMIIKSPTSSVRSPQLESPPEEESDDQLISPAFEIGSMHFSSQSHFKLVLKDPVPLMHIP